MGIKRLTYLLETVVPEALIEKSIDDYNGKMLAIDTSLSLHQNIIAIRGKRGTDLKNKKGDLTSHYHAIWNKTLMYLKKGIFPINVFDGRQPAIKSKTLKERRKIKNRARDKLNSVSDDKISKDEYIKLIKRVFSLTDNILSGVKYLLDLIGLPKIVSPEEADPQCAALCYSGKVYGVVSEDRDLLAFKSSIMLTNFSSRKIVREINLNIILKKMNLSHKQFVELCIILGSDYCPSIKGIGPVNAYKLYKKFGNMEDFIKFIENENLKKIKLNKKPSYIISNEFYKKWKKARDYYIMEAYVYDPNDINLEWNEPKYDELYNFLVKENDFNRKITLKRIEELKKYYNLYRKKLI